MSRESSCWEESNWIPWSAARAGDAAENAAIAATGTAVRGLHLLTPRSLPLQASIGMQCL